LEGSVVGEYRIECEGTPELAQDDWSAVLKVYKQDEPIQDVVVRLTKDAFGILLGVLWDRGAERHWQQIAAAVLRTWGEKRIREQLRAHGSCDTEMSLASRDLAETGKVEEVLREAGLL
jgi:hypothetical protein